MLRPGWRAGRYSITPFRGVVWYLAPRRGENACDQETKDIGSRHRARHHQDRRGLPRREPTGWLPIVVQSQGSRSTAAAGLGRAPGPGTAKLRGDLPVVGRHPLGARFGPLQRAQRVRSAPLSLGPRSLRVPLRRRGSADPFARPERRDRRHPAARRHHHLGLTANASRVGISSLVGHILAAPHHAFDVQGSRARVAPAPDTVLQGPPALPKPSRGYRGQRGQPFRLVLG